ncbi:universal stress protein [Cognatiyoonia sp. IB215182]|uniref:universal stress protein n=1 Tax=Cognatiyoonia sp. IB215182 TaxID=3097353 RepID=UPI002A12DAB5|nr:universal stress protein [Cognatiyoonia sp. IB215182]MDX8351550.1 universal stress protein [Cognatiyoonia sp. IB215182]
MFKTIVVAVDGSDCSKKAVTTACDIAAANGAKMVIVHAPQAETTAFIVGGPVGYHELLTAPSHAELEETGNKIVAEAAELAKEKGCTVETDMHIGDPVRQVLKVAKDKDADLIVMGRRGLGSVASLFLGSTSQKIQHHATCACLTVV